MSLTNNAGGYSMTPADYAAINGCGYGYGYGGGCGMWGNDWWLLLLFILGWGNNGWGFGGGRNGGNCCATTEDVTNAVNQQTIIGKLDGITNGICDSTYALSNTITTGFSQAELSRCNQQAALMQQLYAIAADNAKCCYETQRLIERASCDTNYNIATQSTAIQNSISNSTRDIIDNANSNSRAILDFLTQSKIDQLNQENNALRLQVSQSNQNAVLGAAIDAATAEIIRRTGHDCAIPAYVVPNPNCCYGNPVGVGYGYTGYNNGCCGNGCCGNGCCN